MVHVRDSYVGGFEGFYLYNSVYANCNSIYSGFGTGGWTPDDKFYNCLRYNSGSFFFNQVGCIEGDPLFVDDYFKLQDDSPCIDAGYAWANITTYPESRPPAKGEAAYDIGSWGGRYTLADGSLQTNFYVSKNGNDTTGEGTLLSPYQTLAKCIERIQALGNYGNIYVVTSEVAYEIENVNVELTEHSKIAGYGGTATIHILSGGSFKITGSVEDVDIYTQASTFEIVGTMTNSKVVGSPDYPDEDEVELDVEFAYGTMVGTYEGGGYGWEPRTYEVRLFEAYKDAAFPEPTVPLTFGNNATLEATIVWDESTYDMSTEGIYTVEGYYEYEDEDGTQQYPVTCILEVSVAPTTLGKQFRSI